MKSQSGVYWNNVKARTSTSIVPLKVMLEAKIYSRTADFKDLSAVTTVPDHQSNKTCRRWDSFQYSRLLQYAGIENHVRKYILKQRVTFFCLLRKGKTIVLALPLALHTGPYHAAAVTKFDWGSYNT